MSSASPGGSKDRGQACRRHPASAWERERRCASIAQSRCRPRAGPAVAGVAHDAGGFIPVRRARARIRVRPRARRGRRDDGAPQAQRPRRRPGERGRRDHRGRGGRRRGSHSVVSDPVRHSRRPTTLPGPPDSVWLDNGEPITHCLWWPPGHVTSRTSPPASQRATPVVRSRCSGIRAVLRSPPSGGRGSEQLSSRTAMPEPSRRTPARAGCLAIRRTERVGKNVLVEAQAKGEGLRSPCTPR